MSRFNWFSSLSTVAKKLTKAACLSLISDNSQWALRCGAERARQRSAVPLERRTRDRLGPGFESRQVLRENFKFFSNFSVLTHSAYFGSRPCHPAVRFCDRSRLGRTKVGMPQSWLSNLTMMNVILGQLETQHANFRPGVIPFTQATERHCQAGQSQAAL